jgi:DNA-binding MarR family transcriptional regulator
MKREERQLQLASDLRTVISRLIKKLRTKAPNNDQLSLTERDVIKLLDQHKELLPSELAAMEKVTTQSMSQILNHLLELGFISRKDSETDKRKVIITLSKQGRELLNKTRHERDEWLYMAIGETLTREEQELLRKLIVPLNKVVEFD